MSDSETFDEHIIDYLLLGLAAAGLAFFGIGALIVFILK